MKIDFTKEWCVQMAQLEGGAEIGVGFSAVDPVFDGELMEQRVHDEPKVAFGRFVRLMRRSRGLSIEKLAVDADIEMVELVGIEDDAHYTPDVRTVYQLSTFFNVPRANLLQIAGLAAPKNNRIYEESVRFAARSETVTALSPEERSALETFVAVLSERK